ncbi:LysR family transcriptional regulator, partial [Klebsiella pneumoniae]|uniref:LysR family transcriptional regulator n=1 Tax=Klebsiella pneumoniae TaxID=573 RepID=UPI00272FE3C9
MLMTPSTVSKLIVRLELRLGVRLLERSTRKLSLTDEGRIYYERSIALLAELDAVERVLAQGAQKARGTV